MEAIQEVYEYLKACGTFYLATAEGDQPRVRPFGRWTCTRGSCTFRRGMLSPFLPR